MRCYEGLDLGNWDKSRRRVVAIGAFDGVHFGHQRLISAARDQAHEDGAELVVLTFWPPPQVLLQPGRGARLLCTRRQKAGLMRDLGVDSLVTLSFDRDLAGMSAEHFARGILWEQLGVDQVFVGYNFTFGRDSGGDAETLKAYGADLGFGVRVLPPVRFGDCTISSTRIRRRLEEGRVRSAAELLGRPFSIEGPVVYGEGRGGRQVGYPTANLRPSEMVMLPREGVYAVQVHLEENPSEPHPGVASVGGRPTFVRSEDRPGVEVHILGFEGDLYGSEMKVVFRRRLRDLRAFSSPEALSEQIGRDIEASWGSSDHNAAGGS